ncbi:MAG: hypothetical protein K5639_00210 [Eubacterium sp.]|nr:hypothetical protein [Eubacterium sp.]
MKKHYTQLVTICTILAATAFLCACGSENAIKTESATNSQTSAASTPVNDSTACRPMIKVEGKRYVWDNFINIDSASEYKKIGTVKKSYLDGGKNVSLEDDDFTANTSSVGTIIYREDDEHIITYD